jgi:Bacteriophage Lambda NinG protein
MIREDGDWTCFTCGTQIDPNEKDDRGVSMKAQIQAGHYKPQGIYKSIKYDPLNVRPQCVRCNKWLHGNLAAYSIALEKRFGFGVLQTLERRAKLYFDYAVPLLEKLTAAAKRGAKEYFILYESVRPKEERELKVAA